MPFASLFAALLLAFSCASAERKTGGETHFLRWCEVDSAPCGEAGLSCVCGVCTRPCSESDACPSFPAVECVAKSDEPATCSSSPSENYCDVRCVRDADCAAISSSHRCVAGACRANEPPGANECTTGQVAGNQVVIIGDSFFSLSHQITAYLEELSRSAGALSAGERYRDHSSRVGNALSFGGNGIESQYEQALSEAEVRVVIMNGGGADMLAASCPTPQAECAPLTAAAAAAQQLLARMAADGVAHVVYAFYPDPVDPELRAKADVLRPLIENVCSTSPVPCHWLDLRPAFAGRYAEFVLPDGMNPTAAGAAATADAIWATLQASCIAQ